MKNWDEYDDISENGDNENEKEEKIINEAKKLLFLRKYSNTKIKINELEKIIIESNYDDCCIIKKINNYLINNSKKSKDNNNNNKIHHSRLKRHNKYKHQNNNKKIIYKEREVELDYDKIETNNINEKEENKEQDIKIINLNTRSISTSGNSIASTSPENMNLKHYYSSDLNIEKKNLSPFSIENSSYFPKNSYASYLLGDNYYINDSVDSKLKGAKFPSKLFPGVFFDQPIEKDLIEDNNFNFNFDDNNNTNFNYNWDMVINYYKNPSSSSI